jgi:hypothetical protein
LRLSRSRWRRRRQPLFAFVHIPRTGGGTLSTAIDKNYAAQKSPGNFQRGLEKTRLGLPADTRYITILRDPVDRVLSHYHFHAQAGDPPGRHGPRKLRSIWQALLNNERFERQGGNQEEIVLDRDADYSLEEGLRRKIVIYDNFMTRFLWGGESLFGELPPDALERAKENLSTFWFVGVRERLDDSIILLGRKLGVGLMPYNRRHVSQKRPPLEETSDELRALIAAHNSLDVELYRFARERFDAEAPAPGELDQEVAKLRAKSAEMTAVSEDERVARKGARRARKTELKRAAANASGRGAGGKRLRKARNGVADESENPAAPGPKGAD